MAVLEAADDLLVERGFASVTIEGIAARAGVAKQTIYRWWPSKIDILFDALAADAVARQRERDRAAFLRARERGQLPAGTDIDLVIDQLVGPVYYRVLVTRQSVPPQFTNALVDSCLARAATQPGQDRQHA